MGIPRRGACPPLTGYVPLWSGPERAAWRMDGWSEKELDQLVALSERYPALRPLRTTRPRPRPRALTPGVQGVFDPLLANPESLNFSFKNFGPKTSKGVGSGTFLGQRMLHTPRTLPRGR